LHLPDLSGASPQAEALAGPTSCVHHHGFGQDRRLAGERGTLIVIALTAVTMAVEIAAGLAFGSMALLADGLHMASHTTALAISATAYVYARRHARDQRFCFGTGKVGSLAGFSSALLLALFAAAMAGESVARFLRPVSIAYGEALVVAILGLAVNGASVWILGIHADEHEAGNSRGLADGGDPGHVHAAEDHNLRAAYLHVLADALTSVLAIVALVAGMQLGLGWMDPAMGIVGGVLVARWSWALLRSAGAVLLDRSAPDAVCQSIVRSIERDGDANVADLHVWSIGSGLLAATVVVACDGQRPADHFRRRLAEAVPLAHAAIEVHARHR
jgi:cation diffusion facilitator family transporter